MIELADLKVGDTVLIERDSNTRVAKISKVTQTQIQTKMGEYLTFKFNRVSGREIGGSVWHGATLRVATPDALEATKKANRNDFLQRTMSQTQWGKVSMEKLEMIYQILTQEG